MKLILAITYIAVCSSCVHVIPSEVNEEPSTKTIEQKISSDNLSQDQQEKLWKEIYALKLNSLAYDYLSKRVIKLEQDITELKLAKSEHSLESKSRIDQLIWATEQLITKQPPAFTYVEKSKDVATYKKKIKEVSSALTKKFTEGDQQPSIDTGSIKLGQELSRTRFLGTDGLLLNLNDYIGKKNILLVIMRGFPGKVCIACANQTAALARNKKLFYKKDIEIFIVYPGLVDTLPKFLSAVREVDEEFNLNLPVLYDVNLNAVKNLSIEGELAKPTTILINKEGKVNYVYVGKNKTDRPSIKTLLEATE
jgi:peroxiredoxin